LSATLTVVLQPYFPPITHPAIEIISQNKDTVVVLGLILVASITAPFWEEVAFRGTLLPALSTGLKSPVWGVLLTSFLFAAIHPQGIPAWPPLMVVAAMASILTYQTGSLVPALVLHATHNFVLMTAATLIS
jgi:membrane protease YdiL (CAAX protease family)